MNRIELNKLSKDILSAAFSVHREMGPGLLEAVYEYCLLKELTSRGIYSQNQVFLPLHYKGEKLEKDFRIDLLVSNHIIIEVKAVDVVLPVHEAQIISYLKLANLNLGFLINFNVSLLKEGFRRYVNNF
ncbi:MAG: GxxExxY protein [Bacteroidales bacterium]|jgi:GxxExxY protein|nr:GxxExxY protein [Bacteroidales bacterium]